MKKGNKSKWDMEPQKSSAAQYLTYKDMKKSGGLRSGSSDCSALSSTPGSVRSLAVSLFSVKEGAQ